MSSPDAVGSEDRVRAPGAPVADPATADGTLGAELPAHWCRLCWQDRFVRRDGVWMLQHRGPLDGCTHECHQSDTLLPSTS